MSGCPKMSKVLSFTVLPHRFAGSKFATSRGSDGLGHQLGLFGAQGSYPTRDLFADPFIRAWILFSCAKRVGVAASAKSDQMWDGTPSSGRIRVGDQMTRSPGMLLPLEVSYDNLTVDISENRILRAAVRMMMQLSRLSDDVWARLAHLDAKLDGVSELRYGAPIPA